jgi:hypothetical protein
MDEQLRNLGKVLGKELGATFNELVSGAKGDIQEYAREMAEDALRIVKGNAAEDIGAELKAQALLLAEKYRIRLGRGAIDYVVTAAKLAASVALKVGEAYLNSKIGG